jgi:hypothetical protein
MDTDMDLIQTLVCDTVDDHVRVELNRSPYIKICIKR